MGPVKNGATVGNLFAARVDIKGTDITVVGGIYRERHGEREVTVSIKNNMASHIEEVKAFVAIVLAMGTAFDRVSTHTTEGR